MVRTRATRSKIARHQSYSSSKEKFQFNVHSRVNSLNHLTLNGFSRKYLTPLFPDVCTRLGHMLRYKRKIVVLSLVATEMCRTCTCIIMIYKCINVCSLYKVVYVYFKLNFQCLTMHVYNVPDR